MENYNRPQLADQVAESIQTEIMQGKLKAGEKLPNEYDLAQKLGVGRGTIREAVKQLATRNVLEIRRGSGTYVAQEPGVVEDPLGFAFEPDKNRLALDLCEVRLLLEPQIAALAAERATDEEIDAIRTSCDACVAKIRAGENHTEQDIGFHEAIARASHNGVITKVVPVIQQGVSIFIEVTHSDLVEMTVRTHQQIMDAIARRDENAAYAAMREHLITNRDHINEAVVERESSSPAAMPITE